MKHSCALHERNSPLICLIRVSTTRAYNAYISRGLGFFLFYTALIFTWNDSVVIEDHPLRTFHIKKWQGMSSTKECFSEARIDLLGMTFLWSSRTICQIRYKCVFFFKKACSFFSYGDPKQHPWKAMDDKISTIYYKRTFNRIYHNIHHGIFYNNK